MKERPIIFNDAMVRAILEGRKTQTRRIVKPQPSGFPFLGGSLIEQPGMAGKSPTLVPKACATLMTEHCPFGQPGDRLWVRESFGFLGDEIIYRAGPSSFLGVAGLRDNRWRPSIHMPRWASRITLEITGVRVERLQNISDGDCIAEGCAGGHGAIPGYQYSSTPREHYAWLWQSIYGAESWQSNPWVWCVEFKKVTP